MQRPKRDQAAWDAASEISAICNIGEDMSRNAVVRALTAMPKMLDHFDSKDGKIAALKHHGIYMGLAAQFKGNVIPHAIQMKQDLTAIMGSAKSAEVMTDIWLAKVIQDVFEQVTEYERGN